MRLEPERHSAEFERLDIALQELRRTLAALRELAKPHTAEERHPGDASE
jgi:hypothetical protein